MKKRPMSQRKLRAWEADLRRRGGYLEACSSQLDAEIAARADSIERFNRTIEARRAIKPRLRVKAICRPTNPLDGTRLWDNS